MRVSGLLNYLGLKDVGAPELIFGFSLLLSGYRFLGIPISSVIWLVLILVSFICKRKDEEKLFSPVALFSIYWLLHTLVIALFKDSVNNFGFITQIFYFGAILILSPKLRLTKIRGALNWVAIISIAGLIYQYSFILRGVGIHPLEIPGFEMAEERLDTLLMRPSAFFMEPSAFVSFMICPLALALIEKKWLWAFILILSIFLTTSTTGIALSFIMLGMTVFNQKNIKGTFFIIAIGLILFYSLTHFEIFEVGIDKIENTDTETNVRLTQGKNIVKTMRPEEYLFGVPYSTPYNYCRSGRMTDVIYYGESVFMPTLWELLLLYGIAGLLLYANIYLSIVRRNRIVLPFVMCVVSMWFSGGYGIQGLFAFSTIFLLVLSREGKIIALNNN